MYILTLHNLKIYFSINYYLNICIQPKIYFYTRIINLHDKILNKKNILYNL